jgi:plastocyanin
MHFKQITAASLLALAAGVSSKNINVAVGAGGLTFTPNNITAAIGDKVVFAWAPTTGNHTVTQSTVGDLCKRKEPLTASFASGIHAGAQNFTFTVTVNDTAPIWFFCAVPNHCVKGMYGVINSPPGGAFNVPSGGGAATPSGSAGGAPAGSGTPTPATNSAAALSRSVATSALFAGALAVLAYMI